MTAMKMWSLFILLVASLDVAHAIALPTKTLTPPPTSSLFRYDSPLDIPKRLPISVLDGCVCGALAFLQTAAVMVPGGLVWKFGELRANGWRRWLAAGINMGSEWGAFSAVYSVRWNCLELFLVAFFSFVDVPFFSTCLLSREAKNSSPAFVGRTTS